MCQAALQYARRGWAVFPCRERDETVTTAAGATRVLKAKAPYTGKGLKDATTDEARIQAWWRQHPHALIGVPTGINGCFVLDFDPRTDAETGEIWSLERLKGELEAQMGCALPQSVTAMTQSDGVHLFLRQPPGDPIRNRGNLPQHVDVRGLGGYVIAPPSGMASGARYRWLDRGDWRDDGDIAEAPAALIEVLRAKKAKPASPLRTAAATRARDRSPGAREDAVDAALRKYAMSALEGECRAVRQAPSGKRNSQLNISALKIASLVASGVIDERFARGTIEAAARDNPGEDDEAQLLATVASGWTAGLQGPRDLGEIAAATRARAERPRGPSHVSDSGRASSPGPGNWQNMGSSSQSGGAGFDRQGNGVRGVAGEDVTRDCAMLPHTDLGNLQRFLRRYGDDFLYVEQWGWLAWDGRRWNRDMALALLGRAAQNTMRAIQGEAALVRATGVAETPTPIEASDAGTLAEHAARQDGRIDRVIKAEVRGGDPLLLSDTIAKWGRTSESAGHIACIAKLAEARLSARPDDFDADPLRLNVANGTLVFTRGEAGDAPGSGAQVTLAAFDRRDRITKIADADYDANAKCPKYDAFLAEVQPDADMRAFLDAWSGYNALGLADAQKMALFYGQGSNGKGVWVNTHAGILGDYAWAAAIETFIDQGKYKKGGDASPDLAALAGRRMVYANEPEEGSKFSDGLIKAMTSDEPIGGVRELMKPPFQLLVTFKNTVSANNRPKIGTDHGIQRRMQVVPWNVIIPDERQDLQLKPKLKAEASGILNRIVRGAIVYLTSGLPSAEAIREATKAYLDENDILGKFLALCIVRTPDATIGASALHELFAAWQSWAQLLPASGKPWSPKYLSAQMEKKQFRKRKSSSMLWDDIAAQFEPHDFIDHEGRPVTAALPPPKYPDATAPPAPMRTPVTEEYDDDIPL